MGEFRYAVAAALAAGLALAGPLWAQADAGAPSARRHALLIGCTAYPNLVEDYQLAGPANDVVLIKSLLTERFGYADDEIVTLLHDHPADRQPTAVNIAREFASLAERAAAGDIVFIMIAGHGSQLVNDNPDDPRDDERDGLDEVFLPQDVAEWSLAKAAVGAIRDDQVGAWLDAIRARQATVFFVADTCHSGTMDRGPGSELERARWVNPQVLNPPRDGDVSQPGTRPADETTGPTGVADTQDEDAAALGPLLALYAVSDRALEKEQRMPPYERTDGPVYGRLAYTMSEVLTRARRPLTYLELAQQIGWRYEGWDWRDAGMLSGSPGAFHDEVLGRQSWRDRSTVTLLRDELAMSLDVGHLHGATVGSIYRVFPPVGSEYDDVAVGHVTITELTPTTARVEECEYGDAGVTPFEEFPSPGRCELVYAAASSLKLSVGVAIAPFDSIEGTFGWGPPLEVLRELADQPNSLITLAGEGESPDAYVLLGKKGLYLRRAADAGRDSDQPAPAEVADGAVAEFPTDVFGPFAMDPRTGSPLDRALDQMAKAINIRRLAESSTAMIIGDPNAPVVKLNVQVERKNRDTGVFETVDGRRPIMAGDDDELRVAITNDSDQPVDLTVLYIDSRFAIVSFLPTERQTARGTAANRLAAGQSVTAPFHVRATTLGLEDVIIIATLTTPATPMTNFVFLQQNGIERGAPASNSAADTPLGQLLSTAAFASGTRGGAAAPDMARYAVQRVSWTVVAGAPESK
jgi:hypothetical protein